MNEVPIVPIPETNPDQARLRRIGRKVRERLAALPEVWGPYRWVRYYDDVMLVDIYTGQVVDVIYNFFW